MPEKNVKLPKRKQPVTEALSKKWRNNAMLKIKKEEPEMVGVFPLCFS